MNIINFIKSLVLEIKSIQWAEKKDTAKITVVIIISSVILSFVLWVLDQVIFFIISFIINLRF
ncbi:preprotein translocase subunit SecE [Buchnera aphidicola]|uniref:preprotein translocase subunit SecE n=1 Tax=Buchnera aphidicola TaxID=9 RepID=UPI003D189531